MWLVVWGVSRVWWVVIDVVGMVVMVVSAALFVVVWICGWVVLITVFYVLSG